jgi:hypothetical protein
MNICKSTLAIVISAALVGSTVPAAMAQGLDNVASSTGSKAAAKAQRKADRKAARTKNNAELSDLEKHGYQPGGDQANYPQNLQNAERNSATAKTKAASSQ